MLGHAPIQNMKLTSAQTLPGSPVVAPGSILPRYSARPHNRPLRRSSQCFLSILAITRKKPKSQLRFLRRTDRSGICCVMKMEQLEQMHCQLMPALCAAVLLHVVLAVAITLIQFRPARRHEPPEAVLS